MIKATNLTKTFGEVKAVDALSLHIKAGEVYGLLGPNGAGKTTTLRILSTLLAPDSGAATVNGLDILKQAGEVRKIIGVVNGGMGLYDRLSGQEILDYFGKLYDMPPERVRARTAELDALLELGDTLKRRAGDFSTGMKQKIVIARAVLHDPPIIFFDEATSGLDVMARRSVMNFVRAYPSENRAVIYSTHVMSEVEELCDRAGIIFKGRLVAEASVSDLISEVGAKNLEEAFFAHVERSGLHEVSA